MRRIAQGVDHDLLGTSTITWWNDVKSELGGGTTTTPLYKNFRNAIHTDLRKSTRLAANGLTDIFLDTAKHCFKGAPALPSAPVREAIDTLHHRNHAITSIVKRGHPTTMIASTPSWLTTGRQRHIDFLHDLFYGAAGSTPPGCTHCHLCQRPLHDSKLWQHLLSPCPKLHAVDDTPHWAAFTTLLEQR